MFNIYYCSEGNEKDQLETDFLIAKCAFKTSRYKLALESILS